MRFGLAVTFLASSLATVSAFAPTQNTWGVVQKSLFSAVETEAVAEVAAVEEPVEANGVAAPGISGADIKARLEAQLEKLREKDSKSLKLSKEDIKVAFEDDHIVVVDKPAGVLCVSSKDGAPNLADAVCESFGCQMGRSDMMVVHRLGMDTSGLVVFAKTMDAVRGMNAIFRTRKIERKYEALVCGHVEKDEGMINLPLMRDYECPPFMRISTDEHQQALVGLESSEVGKKLLETPKESLTKYEVISREELDGNAVTRVSLTSISGRTHQLNVHLAAFGHPIVGDSTYGIDGDAVANGGLSDAELESLVGTPSRADEALQKSIASAAQGKSSVHAKSLKFRHPITKEDIELTADAPF
eukprot:CAMPEP_0172471710 /NCGR_PEP_ID=MMETSP1065-20121228/67955_1 /TAXON_ID=265537 /ORGANISM="Amphiprora paludosa, Strain CCMP125" /LENGTH=357 /DNA_ID=CAMNT_0013229823 /DNA_START=449 /DNA_END=1522 /DNA_ORIENTATION=-